MVEKYTKEFLISELHRFVKENNKIPRSHDMIKRNGYPSYAAYQRYFETWDNALLTAKLFPMRMKRIDAVCSICGNIPSKTSQWYIQKESIICNNCYICDRKHINGVLDPNNKVGIGVITEYVVANTLTNIIMCNKEYNFNYKFDLIYNDKTVNVKSSLLHKDIERKNYYWNFRIRKMQEMPDMYICIGFDTTRTNIEKVWIIQNDSKLISKEGIWISNSENALKRAKQYEVDPVPYNKVYQELDIYSLPEFCNLKHEE